jgi:hypothetical protein
MNPYILLIIIAFFCPSCVSYSVSRIGRTNEYKELAGAVVWDDGKVSVKEITVKESESSGRRKILSGERYYLMKPEDVISFRRTSSSNDIKIKYPLASYLVDSNHPLSIETDKLLEVRKNRKEENCWVSIDVDNIPYPLEGKDLCLSLDRRMYSEKSKRSLTGKLVHFVLTPPAVAADIILSPFYLILLPYAFGST